LDCHVAEHTWVTHGKYVDGDPQLPIAGGGFFKVRRFVAAAIGKKHHPCRSLAAEACGEAFQGADEVRGVVFGAEVVERSGDTQLLAEAEAADPHLVSGPPALALGDQLLDPFQAAYRPVQAHALGAIHEKDQI